MASTPAIQSIPDVLRLLEEKQKHLEDLLAQRDQIQRQINDIDWEIQAAATVGRPPRRPKTRSPSLARPVNTAPLRQFVIAALKKQKKGLLISELTSKILEAGYQTQSELFQNVVYQCLYKAPEIEHDPRTGRYSLKKD